MPKIGLAEALPKKVASRPFRNPCPAGWGREIDCLEILRLTDCRLRLMMDAWEESRRTRRKDGKSGEDGGMVENSGEKVVEMLPSDKYYMPVAKIKDFLLKSGAKHSQEFFDVGYTENDIERLNSDIEEQFDEAKAVDYRHEGDATTYFSIYMCLGIVKKKKFRTVWRVDKNIDKPRFITAHRE